MPTLTTAVNVCFNLTSLSSGPPYEVAGCQGSIVYNDNTPVLHFQGFDTETIGTPQPNGATFKLQVYDADFANNQTRVANWALTCIPRGSTQAQSPFDNNQNTISGAGAASDGNGTFTLDVGNARIQNTGDWDYALLIQMVMPDTSIKCFSSDPEMEVGA